MLLFPSASTYIWHNDRFSTLFFVRSIVFFFRIPLSRSLHLTQPLHHSYSPSPPLPLPHVLLRLPSNYFPALLLLLGLRSNPFFLLGVYDSTPPTRNISADEKKEMILPPSHIIYKYFLWDFAQDVFCCRYSSNYIDSIPSSTESFTVTANPTKSRVTKSFHTSTPKRTFIKTFKNSNQIELQFSLVNELKQVFDA